MIKIAVIGDYRSQEYKRLVELTRISNASERVVDLSQYTGAAVLTNKKNRQFDIKESHKVVIAPTWMNNVDSRSDVHFAQLNGKECLIYQDGRFIPFPVTGGGL